MSNSEDVSLGDRIVSVHDLYVGCGDMVWSTEVSTRGRLSREFVEMT